MATSRVIRSTIGRFKIQNVKYSSCLPAVSTNLLSNGHHEAKFYKVRRHPLGLDLNKRWRSGVVEEQAEEVQELVQEEKEDKEDFNTYGISPETQMALRAHGIEKLFPVQYLAYQTVQGGGDVIVKARTGTGKTLAFALPLVEKFLDRRKRRGDLPKAVVLTPTRELAYQVEDHIRRLNNKVRVTCVYGGASYLPQKQSISRGLEIIVGTPGRMKDMIEQGALNLQEIEHVVLDEVDRMLDMGFQEIVDEILSHCYEGGNKPQTLMFSATVPTFVRQAAQRYLSDDVCLIDLIGDNNVQSATTVTQMAVQSEQVTPILLKNLIKTYCEAGGKTIIFCERKSDCDEISRCLPESEPLHGDIKQFRRQDVLSAFKSGNLDVLVTTDVAARGLDIPDVDLVIQTSPPNDKDNFIHRTGRTGRAGKSGNAIMIYKRSEEHDLHLCERVAKVKIARIPIPTADLQAEIRKSVQSLRNINKDDAVELFGEMAEELQAKMGTVESLSTALMALSDLKDFASHSLLSKRKNFRTFLFQPDEEEMPTNKFRQVLEDVMGNEANRIEDIVMTKEGKGLVVDVPVNLIKRLKEGISSEFPDATLKQLFQLPDDVNIQAYGSKSSNDNTDFRDRRTNFRDSRYQERNRSFGRDYGSGRDFHFRDRNRSFGRDYGSGRDYHFRDRNQSFGNDFRRRENYGYQDRNRNYKKNFGGNSFEMERKYERRDHREDEDVHDSFMPY